MQDNTGKNSDGYRQGGLLNRSQGNGGKEGSNLDLHQGVNISEV